MTIIAGTIVDWTVSPRIITIPDPVAEVTLVDLQDTLQDLEDDEAGMVYNKLRAMSGGEDLGGGTTVGFTMQLANAQLAFETRINILEAGTVTTPDTVGKFLTDATALFVTNLVARGDLVQNLTDGSYGTVVEVLSETALRVAGLVGGVDNQFDSADVYNIFDVVSCNIGGGNLVAVDSVGTSIESVFTTFGTQVIRTSASSATTANQAQLEFSTFNGGVTLDSTALTTGVTYPFGTPGTPVNNLAQAQAIATSRGFTTILVLGDYVFDAADSVDGFTFMGESTSKSLMTLTDAATIINCQFENTTVTGALDGGTDLLNCHIDGLTYVDGNVRDCQLDAGAIILEGAQAEFIRCWSGVAGLSTPKIDMNGTGTNLLIRDYQGGLEICNYTSGADDVSIDMSSGHIKLADTVLAGFFLIRGLAKLTDLSNGAVVNSDDLINKALLTEIETEIQELREENPTSQQISTKVWSEELIEFDEEDSAGSLLNTTAESVEVNTPTAIANSVWQRDMSDVFDPNSAGGILKKVKLIYKILIS